jgi:hypothetical protein
MDPKEALLKAVGVGLAGARRLARDPGWLTLPLGVADGYVAAVAVEWERGTAEEAPQLCGLVKYPLAKVGGWLPRFS